MEAFQFVTEATDGTIKIPKQYLSVLKKEFTVIILVQESPGKTPAKETPKRKLKSIKIKTKEFKFDREEANKR